MLEREDAVEERGAGIPQSDGEGMSWDECGTSCRDETSMYQSSPGDSKRAGEGNS